MIDTTQLSVILFIFLVLFVTGIAATFIAAYYAFRAGRMSQDKPYEPLTPDKQPEKQVRSYADVEEFEKHMEEEKNLYVDRK